MAPSGHGQAVAQLWGRLVPTGVGGSSQEPVEQLSSEAQADGGVADVEDEVLLRLEVQVRKCQLQVHHFDPAGEETEMVGWTDGHGEPRARGAGSTHWLML